MDSLVGAMPAGEGGSCLQHRCFGFGVPVEWAALRVTQSHGPHAAVVSSGRCAVFRVVDFAAGSYDLDYAFGQQRAMNAPGKSPPFCAEF